MLFDPQERGLSEMYTGQEGDGWPRVFTVQVKGKQVLESASTDYISNRVRRWTPWTMGMAPL